MKIKLIILGLVIAILTLVGGIYIFILDYPTKVDIYINGEKYTLSQNDDVRELNLYSLNSDASNKIEIKSLSKMDIKVNGKKLWPYISKDLGKLDISEDNRIKVDIKFKNDKKYTTYYFNTLPNNLVEYDIEKNSNEYDGNYYMGTYTADQAISYVYKINSDGEILYYKKCDGFCSQFRKEMSSDNKPRYVYTAQDLSDTQEIDFNNVYGKLIVMDENYNVIDEAKYINNEKSTNDKTYTIFEYLDDNHYLITSSSREKTNDIPEMGELTLIENNIQEIKDGKVIFEWRSSEHKELYDYIEDIESLSLEDVNDYLHINKVIVDPVDNNLIASFRNISTILKIDRKNGNIIWSLGGKNDEFGLEDNQKFGYQHSLSFTKDHSLMIYDNGDNRIALGIKNQSKALKIKLDEKNKKILTYKAYELPGVYSMAMGSVQVVDEENDVLLISYGTGIFGRGPVELIDFKNNKTLFSFNLHSNKMMFSSQLER